MNAALHAAFPLASAPTKILFLDIDGVANSLRTTLAFGARPHGLTGKCLTQFDWTAIGMLRALCRHTGAAIVLSSSWRYDHSPAQVAAALELPIIDATPLNGQSRGEEIESWLATHPEIQRYAIVDDINQFLPEQQDFFVKTSDEEGLTFADYKKLKALLQ